MSFDLPPSQPALLSLIQLLNDVLMRSGCMQNEASSQTADTTSLMPALVALAFMLLARPGTCTRRRIGQVVNVALVALATSMGLCHAISVPATLAISCWLLATTFHRPSIPITITLTAQLMAKFHDGVHKLHGEHAGQKSFAGVIRVRASCGGQLEEEQREGEL
jgi:hypothetical protein